MTIRERFSVVFVVVALGMVGAACGKKADQKVDKADPGPGSAAPVGAPDPERPVKREPAAPAAARADKPQCSYLTEAEVEAVLKAPLKYKDDSPDAEECHLEFASETRVINVEFSVKADFKTEWDMTAAQKVEPVADLGEKAMWLPSPSMPRIYIVKGGHMVGLSIVDLQPGDKKSPSIELAKKILARM